MELGTQNSLLRQGYGGQAELGGAPPSGSALLFESRHILSRLEEVWRALVAEHEPFELVLVPILDGAIPLARDSRSILKRISPETVVQECPLRISRTKGTTLASAVAGEFSGDSSIMKGRVVVIVDDLIDGGETLPLASGRVAASAPAKILSLVVITKRSHSIKADYSCFDLDYSVKEAEQNWIIGYGMDIDDEFRDLNDIYVRCVGELETDHA